MPHLFHTRAVAYEHPAVDAGTLLAEAADAAGIGDKQGRQEVLDFLVTEQRSNSGLRS